MKKYIGAGYYFLRIGSYAIYCCAIWFSSNHLFKEKVTLDIFIFFIKFISVAVVSFLFGGFGVPRFVYEIKKNISFHIPLTLRQKAKRDDIIISSLVPLIIGIFHSYWSASQLLIFLAVAVPSSFLLNITVTRYFFSQYQHLINSYNTTYDFPRDDSMYRKSKNFFSSLQNWKLKSFQDNELFFEVKCAFRRIVNVSFVFTHTEQGESIVVQFEPKTRWKQEDYDYLKKVVEELKQKLIS